MKWRFTINETCTQYILLAYQWSLLKVFSAFFIHLRRCAGLMSLAIWHPSIKLGRNLRRGFFSLFLLSLEYIETKGETIRIYIFRYMGKRPAPFQLLWLYTTTSLIYPKNNISRLFTFYIRSNSFVADNTFSIFLPLFSITLPTNSRLNIYQKRNFIFSTDFYGN